MLWLCLWNIIYIIKSDADGEYYFGVNDGTLVGRELAASYPDGTCNAYHFECIKDPQHIISSINASTPYDCCKLCLSNDNCNSYSFWYTDLPDSSTIQYGNN